MAKEDFKAVLKYPLSTEKGIRLMESENKLIFVVERNATKQEIKKSFEEMFKARVEKVNTYISPNGKKKAYIKLARETRAIDIATQLGMM